MEHSKVDQKNLDVAEMLAKVKRGKTNRRGRLSTVNLLIKVVCLVKR